MQIWRGHKYSVHDNYPQNLLHRLTGFSIRSLTLPGPQTNILRIILHASLSITLHMKPLNNSCWLYFENMSRIQTTSHHFHSYRACWGRHPLSNHQSLLTDVPESIPALLQPILTSHQMTPVKCKPDSFPWPGTLQQLHILIGVKVKLLSMVYPTLRDVSPPSPPPFCLSDPYYTFSLHSTHSDYADILLLLEHSFPKWAQHWPSSHTPFKS